MHSALHSALHMEAATSFASQAYDPCARESPTLEALGWIGLTLAVLVFLAPVETIYKVVRDKSLGDFDSLPFALLLAMALAWVAYALPSITDCHMQILVCNIIGMALELSYLAIFFFYADSRERRLKILLHLALGLVPAGVVAAIACIMDGGHHGDGASILGSATIVFAILGFASPLAIVRLVLRTRSVQYMPLSLTLMILVNCGVWLAYGLLDDDAFVTLCNGAGFGFGLLQLGVYCYVCFLLQPLKGEATPLKSKSPA